MNWTFMLYKMSIEMEIIDNVMCLQHRNTFNESENRDREKNKQNQNDKNSEITSSIHHFHE